MSVADLVRMANQIAANQSYLPPDQASAAVAAHISSFWTPGMRRELVEAVDNGTAQLNEVALNAIRQLQPV
ncbi:MAG: formate dehydrogenase subunit delta [Actinomycetes bacterium]|jgi:formate dehydrogenase subunit delta